MLRPELFVLLASLTPAPADLEAVGVVLSRRPERSVAVLRSGGRTRVVSVGESAFGGRLEAVAPALVVLRFGAERVELRLGGGRGPVNVGAPAVPAPGPDERVLARKDVERRIGEEAPRILAETTLVPVMDAGAVAGFTLTRVPEPSLLTDAGLRAGDVLTRVNDVPIDSLATLMSLWPRLQGESELRALVVRNGQPLTLTVRLR